MSSITRIFVRTWGDVVPAAILSICLVTGAFAADASRAGVVVPELADQRPVEEIQELAEIWVYGKRLSQVIEDAEDDFFLLYNKLNKDYQYDVYCGRMALENGSMIMIRKCVPGFIVNNYANSYGYIGAGSCLGSSFGYWGSSGSYDGGSISPCGGYGNSFGFTGPVYLSDLLPPMQLMLMEKRPAYAANVLKVVTGDTRLLEKVKHLGDLYQDMELVQGHYVKVKGTGAPPRNSRKGARPNVGPRVL